MTLEKDIIIVNESGLHARPAALFVQMANKFKSDVLLIKDGHKVNGKSIMGLLTIAAEKGSKVTLVVDGEDADIALKELSDILSRDIEEDSSSPG